MRLLHMSDLHLGKRLYEASLLEDQAFILEQICVAAREARPDAVLLAGDLYDKAAPPAEAVQLFDEFLSRLAADGQRVFAISGNHDSAARVAYGARLMKKSGVYLSAAAYDGAARPVTLEDAAGPVDIFLLPFIKPVHVQRAFPEAAAESCTDALRTAVAHMAVDPARRSVLVAHQFVTGAVRSDSEEISIGGLDAVDASVFAPFSYTALGHIHRPQNIGSPRVRYSGTPLAYSFSETDHVKSLTLAEIDAAGGVSVQTLPLTPRRPLREIRGTYAELTLRKNYEGTATDDYLRIVLTDEDDVPDAMRRLKTIYPNALRLDYDNLRTRARAAAGAEPEAETRTPLALLEAFYERQNRRPMSGEQRAYAEDCVRTVWEGEA